MRVILRHCGHMLTLNLLTTREFAGLLGVTRQHVARLVREGKLQPAATLGNGSYLFTEDQSKPGDSK